MSAVSVWRRLPACGQTREAGPSMTSSVTSSPRWAGRRGVERRGAPPAVRRRALAGRSDDVGRGLVTRRRGDPQLEAAERGGLDQRMADVVPGADEGDPGTR